MYHLNSFKLLITSSLLLLIAQAEAGVTIQGTRIIFPANAQSVSVQLDNSFDTPALLQTWIDTGDINTIPDATKIPFVLTPELTRIEPHSGQVIRIIPTHEPALPQDRESIFWFNLLDIPPQSKGNEGKNSLSFNVRTRIKLFYRPSSLKMSQEAAFKSVKFNYNNTSGMLVVTNNTPYYMNFEKIGFNTGKRLLQVSSPMLTPPFTSKDIKAKTLTSKIQSIDYTLINDMGGYFNGSYKL